MMTIEAVAHYPWCGDGTPEDWATGALARSTDRGEIQSGQVLGAWMGGWLPVILFTFRFGVARHPDNGLNFDEAKLLAENLAEAIVGEMDVQILGLKVVPA